MKRHTIAICSRSPILSAGIRSLVQSVRDISLDIVEISYSDLYDYLSHYNPLASIVDLADSDVVSEISRCKKDLTPSPVFIGLCLAALPLPIIKLADSTLSVYDTSQNLSEILKKRISSSNEEVSNELTPREKEVIKGIVKGLSNKEIASEINVSVNTVMTHRRNIASKLKIHSPAGLTIFAIVSKLISLEEIKEHIGPINH